jgi:hypothetical protein
MTPNSSRGISDAGTPNSLESAGIKMTMSFICSYRNKKYGVFGS